MDEQTTIYTGCIPSKIDIRDYKVQSPVPSTSLPEKYEINLRCKVKNQGSVSSCVAHATSSILEHYDNGMNNLSTNFIYGIQRNLFNRDSMGMYLQDACKIVQKYGDMLESDCPGNNEVPTCFSIAENAAKDKSKADKAYKFHISNYFGCDTTNDIKYAIMTYGPVLGCIKVYSKYKLDLHKVMRNDTSSSLYYHGVVLYGWNEYGFLFQNSWGPTFGNSGRAIIPFDQVVEAKVLIDYNESKPDTALIIKKNPKILDGFYKTTNFILDKINRLCKK